MCVIHSTLMAFDLCVCTAIVSTCSIRFASRKVKRGNKTNHKENRIHSSSFAAATAAVRLCSVPNSRRFAAFLSSVFTMNYKYHELAADHISTFSFTNYFNISSARFSFCSALFQFNLLMVQSGFRTVCNAKAFQFVVIHS